MSGTNDPATDMNPVTPPPVAPAPGPASLPGAPVDQVAPAVQVAQVKSRRRIPPLAYGIVVIAIFAGTIGVASAAGLLQTSGRTTSGGGQVTLAGESSTEVKGWMAIGDVADAFGVPLADILVEFGLPADTAPSTALKELESDLFSVSALREWLETSGAVTP